MSDSLRLWLVLLGAAILVACDARIERGPAAEELVTLEEIRNASVAGLFDEPVQLVDGRWEGEPYQAGGASRPAAGIAGDLLLRGDLDGDGVEEAVAFLWSSTGGSGTRNYLGVFGRDSTGSRHIATAFIGDRVQVRGGRIVDGRIELDVVQHGPDDARCCPGTNATREWSFDGRSLDEGPARIGGRMGIADLEGYEWRLARFGIHDETAGEAETLVVEGERVSGRAACNRYTGTISNGESPGEIRIGQLASTRMACPDETLMLREQEFFAALEAVDRFGYVTGQLTLTARPGDAVVTLYFTQ